MSDPCSSTPTVEFRTIWYFSYLSQLFPVLRLPRLTNCTRRQLDNPLAHPLYSTIQNLSINTRFPLFTLPLCFAHESGTRFKKCWTLSTLNLANISHTRCILLLFTVKKIYSNLTPLTISPFIICVLRSHYICLVSHTNPKPHTNIFSHSSPSPFRSLSWPMFSDHCIRS